MNKHMIAGAASTLLVLAPLAVVAPGPAATASMSSGRVVVGPHGSDNAAGTAGHPLRTVRAAVPTPAPVTLVSAGSTRGPRTCPLTG